jgi:dTDP-4-amino-4,6-dideoxygalactose transaminase
MQMDIGRSVALAIQSGIYLNGQYVQAFEEQWAEFNDVPYCVSCGTGTAAIEIAVRAYLPKFEIEGLQVQANTCQFTLTGIRRGTDIPIDIVDVSPADGWPLEYSKYTVPVLLYGRDVPQYNDCFRIVDACQAAGLRIDSKMIACWSFYPTKVLGTGGDGGAITTEDADLADEMRRIAADIPSRLSEINAAILLHRLKTIYEEIAWRRRVAEMYWDNLPPDVVSVVHPDDISNYHIFPVLTERRDELIAYAYARGIGLRIHYPRPLNPLLPGASSWAHHILSLPIYPGLTRPQVSHVCKTIRAFFK